MLYLLFLDIPEREFRFFFFLRDGVQYNFNFDSNVSPTSADKGLNNVSGEAGITASPTLG